LFLHALHDFVTVRLGESLEGGLADNVAQVDVIFAVLGLAKLIDKELYRVWRRAHETQASQMAHLLARGVVQAVNKVDFMIQEGGLGDSGRDNGYLGEQWLVYHSPDTYLVKRKSHCLTIQKQDLHLGR
jgi:hypothetical protein